MRWARDSNKIKVDTAASAPDAGLTDHSDRGTHHAIPIRNKNYDTAHDATTIPSRGPETRYYPVGARAGCWGWFCCSPPQRARHPKLIWARRHSPLPSSAWPTANPWAHPPMSRRGPHGRCNRRWFAARVPGQSCQIGIPAVLDPFAHMPCTCSKPNGLTSTRQSRWCPVRCALALPS
jgi:hypothetical protein